MREMTKQWTTENELNLLQEVVEACQTGIASALADPSTALGFARQLRGSLDALNLVSEEREKGVRGNTAILQNADGLIEAALKDVIARRLAHGGVGSGLAGSGCLDVAPLVCPVPTVQRSANGGVPLFSEISKRYIEKRGAIVGLDNPDVEAHWKQRELWLALIGDKPVNEYLPSDLQDFVIQLKHWPRNSSKIAEFAGMTTQQILKANKTLKYAPLARNTLKNKYVAFIRAMARDGMLEHRYQDPFAGARLRFPNTSAAPVRREHLGAEVINKTFELGVQSGRIDLALLPAMALLTSRRIGLLIHLRGKDIFKRDGVYLARVPDVQLVNGVYQTVPVKTDESTSTFVLHNWLAIIGFSQWAMERGDNWLFPQPHKHPDPSKYASKKLNALLKKAGARGGNMEVFHSFRHEAIDSLDDIGVSEAQVRVQSGHSSNDVHAIYQQPRLKSHSLWAIANRKLDDEVKWDLLCGIAYDCFARKNR